MFFNILGVVTWEENEDLKVSLLKSLDMVSADPKTVNYKTFRGRSRNYKKFSLTSCGPIYMRYLICV